METKHNYRIHSFFRILFIKHLLSHYLSENYDVDVLLV